MTSRRSSSTSRRSFDAATATESTRGPSLPGPFGVLALLIFAVGLAVRLVHLWQMRASPLFTILLGDGRAGVEPLVRALTAGWA